MRINVVIPQHRFNNIKAKAWDFYALGIIGLLSTVLGFSLLVAIKAPNVYYLGRGSGIAKPVETPINEYVAFAGRIFTRAFNVSAPNMERRIIFLKKYISVAAFAQLREFYQKEEMSLSDYNKRLVESNSFNLVSDVGNVQYFLQEGRLIVVMVIQSHLMDSQYRVIKELSKVSKIEMTLSIIEKNENGENQIVIKELKIQELT